MPTLVFIVLCLIWGSTWLAIKLGLADLPALTSVSIRFLLAVVILGCIAAIRRASLGANWKERLIVATPGLFLYASSYSLVYLAEQRIDSSLMAILFGSFPFFMALFSRITNLEAPLSIRGWIGMTIGFVGLCVVSAQSIGESKELLIGTILGILGSATSALGVAMHRKYASHVSIISSTFLQMSLGVLVMGLAALIFESGEVIQWTPMAIGSIIYLAIFGTVIGFVAYYWLMERATTVSVSMITFVTPFVAIILGVTLGNEALRLNVILGGVLILIGVALVVLKRKETAS